MADTGCNAYRFGIEWARIEPQEGKFSPKAISHYRSVLQFCHDNGITPLVTLHHFSSPAWLISKGGWGKPYVVGAFARYAHKVVEELGDLIPYVCTINEANMGYQINAVARDMMKANKKKEGDIQMGQNVDLDIKAILLGILKMEVK